MNGEPKHKTLEPFLATLEVGAPRAHERLTVIPLSGNGVPSIDYLLAADAIESGNLEVTEIDESGSIPELLVSSSVAQPIILIDGEELVGAKQDRILNTTILVPAASKAKIPVSCVESGRWSYKRRSFSSGGYSSSRLRAAKSQSVGRSLRETGLADSDQGEVWDHVETHMTELGTSSGTMALHDAIDQRSSSIEEYTEKLTYPAGARGVVIALGGKFAAMDLFDRPTTLERVWQRLLTGYVLDAIGRPEDDRGSFGPDDAEALIKKVGQAECQPCPSAGIGEDWRFETDEIVGQALVAEGTCVHACAFPARS